MARQSKEAYIADTQARSGQWARGLRLAGILKRFSSADDMALSDRDFVRATIARYEADQPREIVDVGE